MGGPYTVAEEEDEALVGTVLADRYLVRRALGRGMSGTVFSVEQVHFEKLLALKILGSRYVTLDVLRGIVETDARPAWLVTHPCLCEVFDVGELPNGRPFVATEYLAGETLRQRLTRGEPISVADAIDVTMQVLSAIEAMHARDLLLRELRPQNVFLAERRGCAPVVKILDVGLARTLPVECAREGWTLHGGAAQSDVLAAVHYWSPERTGDDGTTEPTSDLFVAALLLYEMLTRRRPFAADSLSGLFSELSRSAPKPARELRRDVPLPLDDFVLRALSNDPQARPATARDMQDELRVIAQASPRSVVSSVQSGVDSAESVAHTPRRGAASAALPLPSLVDDEADLYAEETSTDRKLFLESLADTGESPPVEISARRFSDEASAENPARTLRPPLPSTTEVDSLDVEVDLEIEDTTSQDALDVGAPQDDDRTETTMRLPEELRLRAQEHLNAASEETVPPPPTRKQR